MAGATLAMGGAKKKATRGRDKESEMSQGDGRWRRLVAPGDTGQASGCKGAGAVTKRRTPR